MEPTPKKRTRAYTTTAGERVTKYSDGSETRVATQNPTTASTSTPTVPTAPPATNITAAIPAAKSEE